MAKAKKKATRAGRGKVAKPRPFRQMYSVGLDVRGNPALYWWEGDKGSVLLTNSPQWLDALAEWLTKGAAWMRAEEARIMAKRAKSAPIPPKRRAAR